MITEKHFEEKCDTIIKKWIIRCIQTNVGEKVDSNLMMKLSVDRLEFLEENSR